MKDILLKLNSLKSVIQLTENKVGLNTITEAVNELEAFKENLIPYIYDFAWNYGRFYHIGDAEKIIAAVKERMQLPEEFISEINLNNSIVDEFLRQYPEYRCLDVIGKFSNWLKSKK